MTPQRRHRDSFVFRIWWEQAGAAASGPLTWRGWVQHVRSGEEAYVQDVAALLDFIERRAGRLNTDRLPAPRLR